MNDVMKLLLTLVIGYLLGRAQGYPQSGKRQFRHNQYAACDGQKIRFADVRG